MDKLFPDNVSSVLRTNRLVCGVGGALDSGVSQRVPGLWARREHWIQARAVGMDRNEEDSISMSALESFSSPNHMCSWCMGSCPTHRILRHFLSYRARE